MVRTVLRRIPRFAGRQPKPALLLPSTLTVSHAATMAAAWKPSELVSGDYFDVFPLGKDRIGFCIADVSGHGIPAALLMSNAQSLVRLLASEDSVPSDLCARHRADAPEVVKESVLRAIDSHSQGHADDDITLLCIARKGNEGPTLQAIRALDLPGKGAVTSSVA